MEEVPKFKSRSPDPVPTFFDLILHVFVSAPGDQSACQIWNV